LTEKHLLLCVDRRKIPDLSSGASRKADTFCGKENSFDFSVLILSSWRIQLEGEGKQKEKAKKKQKTGKRKIFVAENRIGA
jgi:hypothetical protein